MQTWQPLLKREFQQVTDKPVTTTIDLLRHGDVEGGRKYRGQLDDSRPGNGIPVTGNDLRNALYCLLNYKENTTKQKPSIGCNIKWK